MEFGTTAQGTKTAVPPIPRVDNAPTAPAGDNVRDVVRQIAKEVQQAVQDAKADRAATRADRADRADRAAAKADQAAAVTGQPPGGGIATTAPPSEFNFPQDIPPQVMLAINQTFVFVAVLVLGSQLLRIIARRTDKRAQALAAPGPDLSPQLRQLQESVDAMAIEVERISEGQRFTAKLMADRLAAPALLEGEKRD